MIGGMGENTPFAKQSRKKERDKGQDNIGLNFCGTQLIGGPN